MILEVKNVIKKFGGIVAVDNVTLEIKPGLITALIGPNGSGKTTLTNVISGLLPMDGGTLFINNVSLEKIAPHEISFYKITRTFQNVRLFEQMTVLDNILVVLTERNVFRSIFEKRKEYHLKEAKEILRTVSLWEKRNELAVNLSYGQRKLLEIGRALALKAEIFLFDEPFAGLFPEMVKFVAELIKNLRAEGKAIILIEHNMDLIREISDYIYVLDSGKLLAEGKPEAVLSRQDVLEAYLGA